MMKLSRSLAVLLLALLYGVRSMAASSHTDERMSSMSSANTLLRPVNPATALIPGISQAVIGNGGKTMYLSGHVALMPDGTVASGLEAQLKQVFENLSATLATAGASAANLARMTIYVRNFRPEQLPVIRQLRDQFINPDLPPASALIGVAELFHPDVLVEVDAVAVLPE